MIDLIIDDQGVATLALGRPERRNALSADMIEALTGTVKTLAADDSVRVVVLAADGEVFCAGGDLGWVRNQIAATSDERRKAASDLAAMLGAINSLPYPVIGRVQGDAYGGGIGLMSVCDVVYAADHVRFALTETQLGMIPSVITPFIAAKTGVGVLRDIALSSRSFGVDAAIDLGLVSAAVPERDLAKAVGAAVAPYLNCAPAAIAAAKAQLLDMGAQPDATAIDQAIDAFVDHWDRPEVAEGLSAFFDNRAPDWAPHWVPDRAPKQTGTK